MGALQNYIDGLKKKIAQKEPMSEIEIIRYIYINLGKIMNFNLEYSFGTIRQREKIYNQAINEENLNKAFEDKCVICKNLAYLFKRILAEFGIEANVEESECFSILMHAYNTIRLKDGKIAIFDLEGDLEFIQSGSKTKYFGIIKDDSIFEEQKMLISENELKKIDKTTAEYIPWGFYFEEMLAMLKLGIKSMSLEEKLRNVLDNLDVYFRDITMGYRERIYYHNRVFHEVFKPKELKKIRQIDCYRQVGDKKQFVSCVVLNRNKDGKLMFLYSEKTGRYEEMTIADLKNEINNGLRATKKIQGLRKYLKSGSEQTERKIQENVVDSIFSAVRHIPDDEQK